MEKIETGVMIMKDGKAWGVVWEDRREGICYGWVEPTEGIIHNIKTDDIDKYTSYTKQLENAKLVNVERKTTITLTVIE